MVLASRPLYFSGKDYQDFVHGQLSMTIIGQWPKPYYQPTKQTIIEKCQQSEWCDLGIWVRSFSTLNLPM